MRLAYATDTSITYYRRVLKGIAQFARARGDLDLHIHTITCPEEFAALDRERYSGIILGTYLERHPQAGRLRTPALSVSNTHPDLRFPKVVSDDFEAGRVAALHLHNKGYKHFAFCGGEVVFAQQRWEGFRQTVQRTRGGRCTPARSGAHGQQLRKWLGSLPRPLALLAANDATAAEVSDACHSLGWRIPEDVAIVGVDDDELYSELGNPPISSVTLRTERIGYLAAERLLQVVQGGKVAATTLVPPGPLIARESSRGVATSDELVVQPVRHMQQHLGSGINVAGIADALAVSRRALELRFKAALGQTPGQELLRLKLEHATGLLTATSLPLKQIARLSGFGRPTRMSQAFKLHLGQSPMACRRGEALPTGKARRHGRPRGARGQRRASAE